MKENCSMNGEKGKNKLRDKEKGTRRKGQGERDKEN